MESSACKYKTLKNYVQGGHFILDLFSEYGKQSLTSINLLKTCGKHYMEHGHNHVQK